MSTLKHKSLTDLGEIAKEIIKQSKARPIICFYGDLGTGKTTLIKEICKFMGVKDEVNSPTFSIVNEYLSIKQETVYHFDLYRLKSLEEAYDIGIEEYLDSGNYVFIEWPEIIHSILPEEHLAVCITYNEAGWRDYELNNESSQAI